MNMRKYILAVAASLAVIAATPVYGAKKYHEMNVGKLEKLAGKDDHKAQYYLARSYAEGLRGAEQDFAKAAYWYAKAAAAGYGSSQFDLAVYYMQGKGVETNPQEGIRLFKLCVDNPDAFSEARFQSCINLANFYANGKYGLEEDLDKAILLMENARLAYFSTDNSEMVFYGTRDDMLGDFYYRKGMKTLEADDYRKSADYYEKAADDWYRYSKYSTDVKKNSERMGNSWLNAGNSLFLYNTFSGSDDYTKVFDYWRKSSMNSNSQSYYNLGELYYTGVGNIPADEEKGIWYLSKVASSNPRAAYFLGIHYYAKTKDFTKAFDYFNKALASPKLTDKDVRADVLLKLSAMYRFGRGTAVNEAKADELSAEAATLGNPDAVRIQQWLNQR